MLLRLRERRECRSRQPMNHSNGPDAARSPDGGPVPAPLMDTLHNPSVIPAEAGIQSGRSSKLVAASLRPPDPAGSFSLTKHLAQFLRHSREEPAPYSIRGGNPPPQPATTGVGATLVVARSRFPCAHGIASCRRRRTPFDSPRRSGAHSLDKSSAQQLHHSRGGGNPPPQPATTGVGATLVVARSQSPCTNAAAAPRRSGPLSHGERARVRGRMTYPMPVRTS